MNKVDILARVLKLKHELGDGSWHDKNGEWQGCPSMLNRILDMIGEYSQ